MTPLNVLVVFDDEHEDTGPVTAAIKGLAPHGISVRTLRLASFRLSQWFQNKLLRRSLPRHGVKLLHVFGTKAPEFLSSEFGVPVLFSPFCLDTAQLKKTANDVVQKFPSVKKKMLLYPFQKDIAASLGGLIDADVLADPVSPPTVSVETCDKYRWGMGLVPGRLVVSVFPDSLDLRGWETFIEGCDGWLRSNASFQLLIYSVEAHRKAFRRTISNRQLDQNCFWADPATDGDLFCLTGDVVAFPSHLNSSFRNLFHAMAAQKPVIAVENDLSHAVVQNGRTGLLLKSPRPTDWGEALSYLTKESARRVSMGEAAFETITKEHNPEAIFREWAKTIRFLVE